MMMMSFPDDEERKKGGRKEEISLPCLGKTPSKGKGDRLLHPLEGDIKRWRFLDLSFKATPFPVDIIFRRLSIISLQKTYARSLLPVSTI